MRMGVVAAVAVAGWVVSAGSALGEEPFHFALGLEPSTRIGVEVQPMTPQLRAYFQAPEDRGVLVAAVEEGSPAERAGLQAGDVITAAADVPVRRLRDLREAIRDSGEGREVILRVVRGGETIDKPVTPEQVEGRDFVFDLEELGRQGYHQLEPRIEELERRLQEVERKLRREIELRSGTEHAT